MEDEGYKSTDLKFPDDDVVTPAAEKIPPSGTVIVDSATSPPEDKPVEMVLSPEFRVVFGDPNAKHDKEAGGVDLPVDMPEEVVDKFHREEKKHKLRNIRTWVVSAVAVVVAVGAAYKFSGESDKKSADKKPEQTKPVPTAPLATPSPITPHPSVTVKCDFSFQPPEVKWDCGNQVVDTSIKLDEEKSAGKNYGGVFTFTTVDGQEVDCELTLQKPKSRKVPQKLDSTLLNCEEVEK